MKFDHVEAPQLLITGASGGIGLGFVQQLVERYPTSQMFATYRRAESATDLLAIAQQYPQLICLQMDITDEESIAGAIAQIRTKTDRLHGVVNCVGLLHDGTLQPEKSLRQIQADQLMTYFQVNSVGAIVLAKHLAPLLKHGDRSLFATISAKLASIGDNQLGGWYGYRASKTALNMFLRTLAVEFRRTHPRTIVVALHPGTTDTQLSKPFQRNVPAEKLFSVDRTVAQLLQVMDGLTDADSGAFFSWDGSRLPW
jgi:NAD(P)-dependent dehydrogenase (short-subunit alcohol dehydrogenase family)